MRHVYETSSSNQDATLDHIENSMQLWRYRRAIDLASVRDHLNQNNEGKKYELLQFFIREVRPLYNYIKIKLTTIHVRLFRTCLSDSGAKNMQLVRGNQKLHIALKIQRVL